MNKDIQEAIQRLRSEDHQKRSQGWRFLYECRSVEAVEPLINALADQHPYVKETAANFLGVFSDARAVEPLIVCLADPLDDVVAAAARALGEIGDPRAVEPLGELLQRSALEWSLSFYAVSTALRKIGDRRAFERVLTRFIHFPDPSLATVLGKLGDERAVEPLIKALEEHRSHKTWDRVIRCYIVRALGKLGDERALPILEWTFEHDTEPAVQGKSASSMAARVIEKIREQREGRDDQSSTN